MHPIKINYSVKQIVYNILFYCKVVGKTILSTWGHYSMNKHSTFILLVPMYLNFLYKNIFSLFLETRYNKFQILVRQFSDFVFLLFSNVIIFPWYLLWMYSELNLWFCFMASPRHVLLKPKRPMSKERLHDSCCVVSRYHD